MQIEIAEPARMTQTGSSLIRLIQNNNMPVLDLLVRESIQNSLDARKPDSKFIDVNYITGKFQSDLLGNELEELSDSLFERYGENEYEFLAIRDFNTVGLTGVMDYKKVKNNEYGNLLKLVYEICKPQEAEGAGGSWGIGKTVYFRVGIGLVIYYSRILNEQGDYEVRLAASLVENETDPNAMIPEYKGMSKRGIAWWGNRVEENVTQPITEEKYINMFLSIFGITPYKDDETGTTIIIPYLNSEELLANNRVEYLNEQDQTIIPFWGYSLEKYISIATQRWYAPRLNNVHYKDGAYLRLKINDKGIGIDSMEPIFKVIQSLYNRANYIDNEDILSNVEDKNVEAINVRKYLQDSTIGVLSFAKVTRELLQMNPPYNKPEPYMYFNNEIRDTDINRPTICFTRKPAMIVAYENVGAWVSKIDATKKNEYILGLFVLNSYNKLRNCKSTETLEEYIRKSEMADHTSWGDWSEGDYNPRLVSKIQNNVNKIVSRVFSKEKEKSTPKVNSGLGKMFGDLLLPPEGFGKGSSPTPKPTPTPDKLKKTGRMKFDVDNENVRYNASGMIVPIVLKTSMKNRINYAGFNILIDSESKKISINEWENKMGLESPFEIQNFKICLESFDGKKINEEQMISAEESIEISDLIFSGVRTKNNKCYGLDIYADEPHYMTIRIEVNIKIKRNDVKPTFSFEKGVK